MIVKSRWSLCLVVGHLTVAERVLLLRWLHRGSNRHRKGWCHWNTVVVAVANPWPRRRQQLLKTKIFVSDAIKYLIHARRHITNLIFLATWKFLFYLSLPICISAWSERFEELFDSLLRGSPFLVARVILQPNENQGVRALDDWFTPGQDFSLKNIIKKLCNVKIYLWMQCCMPWMASCSYAGTTTCRRPNLDLFRASRAEVGAGAWASGPEGALISLLSGRATMKERGSGDPAKSRSMWAREASSSSSQAGAFTSKEPLTGQNSRNGL